MTDEPKKTHRPSRVTGAYQRLEIIEYDDPEEFLKAIGGWYGKGYKDGGGRTGARLLAGPGRGNWWANLIYISQK